MARVRVKYAINKCCSSPWAALHCIAGEAASSDSSGCAIERETVETFSGFLYKAASDLFYCFICSFHIMLITSFYCL